MTYIYGEGWYFCTSWKVMTDNFQIYIENDKDEMIIIPKSLVKEIVRNDY